MSAITSNPLAIAANPTLALNGMAVGAATGGGNLNLGNMLGATSNYNAQMAPGTTEQLTGAQGTYNQNIAGQQALIKALQSQANGTSVNPAQAMLNQATNQNIKQNAGMISSQKGINPAQAIRQAGQNQAAMSQQAAGQAATMGAQQQINAQNQMANVYGQIGNQALSQQNIAQQGFYAPQSINAGTAATNAKTNAAIIGGGLQAGGAAMGLAHGGMVHENYADGGLIGAPSLDPMSNASRFFNEEASAAIPEMNMGFGQHKKDFSGDADEPLVSGIGGGGGGGKLGQSISSGPMSGGGKVPGKAPVKGDSYSNDIVDAKLSPGEIVIPRSIVNSKNPGEAAKAFVEQQLAKQSGARKNQRYADGGEVSQQQDEEAPKLSESDQEFQNLKDQYGDKAYSPGFQQELEEKKNFNNAMSPAPLADPSSLTSSNESSPATDIEGQPSTQSSVAQSSPTTTQGPDVLGNNAYTNALGSGVAEQKAGIAQEAQAQGQLGQRESQILDQGNQGIQKLTDDYARNSQSLMDEAKKASQDYFNGKIDPNHYWNEKSTAGKIGSVIGLILGGIGSGLTGQENMAFKYLNTQIDRDIESQKVNMDKKKNLMSYNMQMLGNLRDATQMTKAMQMDVVSNKLKQAAAQAQDPIARARALQEAGKIDQQIAPMMQQIAMRRTLMGGVSQGKADPSMVIRAYVPEAQQEKYYKELQTMQNTTRARDNILGAFDQVNKINTVGNTIMSPFQRGKQVDAITKPLTAGLSKETAGRFTEQDAQMLEALWPARGDSAETVAQKRAQIEKLVSEKMNFPMLKPLGITPESMSRFGQGGQKRISLGAPSI